MRTRSVAATPGMSQTWSYVLDFNQEPPPDMIARKGRFTWIKPTDKARGQVYMDKADGNTSIEIPFDIPPRPFECIMEVDPRTIQPEFAFGSNWLDGDYQLKVQQRMMLAHIVGILKPQPFICRMVYIEDYIVMYMQGQLVSVSWTGKPYPRKRIAMGNSRNLGVYAVKLRELRPEELTGDLADPAKTFEAIDEKKHIYLK
jgi:hypothetical protein